MGGKAFTNDDSNLDFPRLPPDLYKQLKKDMVGRLSEHFEHACVPIEAPEKDSYGDIDVLVCKPLGPNNICDPATLCQSLGARFWKQVKGSDTINLAFDFPETKHNSVSSDSCGLLSDSCSPTSATLLGSTDSHALHTSSTRSEYFFQVDVQICDGEKSLEWMLFSHAHGDMWNIIGSMIRPFGLVRNQLGLLIVIADFINESGGIPKNLQRVLVTDDPSSVLGFLGLDSSRYWKPFESAEQLFDYAAGCRFYVTLGSTGSDALPSDKTGHIKTTATFEGEKKNEMNCLSNPNNEHSSPGHGSDRRKAKQRPLFNRWVTEYMPVHPPRPSFPLAVRPGTHTVVEEVDQAFSKTTVASLGNKMAGPAEARCLNAENQVVASEVASGASISASSSNLFPSAKIRAIEASQTAREFFGDHFATRYKTAQDRSLLVRGVTRLWADIRQTLKDEHGAEGGDLGYSMKGLKRCVQPEGFDAWMQGVLARGELETLEPTPCPTPFPSTDTAFPDDNESSNDNDKQRLQDLLGFYVPGIPMVRSCFLKSEFDNVKQWVFGRSLDSGNDDGNNSVPMWRLVAQLQEEKDRAESSRR